LNRLEIVMAVEAVCSIIESVHGNQASAGVHRSGDDPLKCVE
jgi:hypothetical protein